MRISRRRLLQQLTAAGGAASAAFAMEAFGLTFETPAGAEAFELPRSGHGRSVIVLGAGIAGLVAAYELQRAGYDVTVLEARDRVGGRVWTIRDGDRIEHIGEPDQRAVISEGLYFNAGAARIPHSHRVMLGYARRFGVPMEPFINTNRSARWDFAGQVRPERRMIMDMRGRMTELLAKAIDRRALDQELSATTLKALRAFLAAYGSIGPNGYSPGGRSGYSVERGGYLQAPRPLEPLSLDELLASPVAALPHFLETIFDMQAPLLQPVGGMDRIAHALYDQVRPAVRLRSPVTAIRRHEQGVRIHHGPGTRTTKADYCVCALPANLVGLIPNDFSPTKKGAFSGIESAPAVKVAFDAPRFWESDDQIFGGLSWTDRITENVIYPSERLLSVRGMLVAAYAAGWFSDDNPVKLTSMTHEQRVHASRQSIEGLHPGKSRLFGGGISVAWAKIPWSEGVGQVRQDWSQNPRGPRYSELAKPEGPVVFAGDYLSYVNSWQEGAALSAHAAVKLVHAMATERRLKST